MKIICIGRNYANHAKELGNQVPDEPVIFIKPETALLNTNEFKMPVFSQEIHYELELVIKINQNCKNISEKEAHNFYDEIALGIDFTARDLQTKLKNKGLPWEKAKAFDGSAYLSDFMPIQNLAYQKNIFFELFINQKTVQQGYSQDMLFNFDEIIAAASTYFTLEKNDLIYTGTPQGVGKINSGDILVGKLEEKDIFELKVL